MSATKTACLACVCALALGGVAMAPGGRNLATGNAVACLDGYCEQTGAYARGGAQW